MEQLPFVPESVLDIGANVGCWTAMARSWWPTASYLLIEANPGCRGALREAGEDFLIALLGSEPNPSAAFYTLDGTATGGSVYKELTSFYQSVEPVYLEQVRLDDLVPDRTFDFIKIDTQGSELDILEGAPRIRDAAKAIQLEISTRPYNKGAPLIDEVCSKMASWGFYYMIVLDYCDDIHQGDYLFLRDNPCED